MSTLIASVAERNRQRRQLAEQAVRLAMQNQWQEAIDVNRQIIELIPDEAEAWNRLGKALSELGRYGESREAYTEASNRDPNNTIAQKQLKRLALLAEAEQGGESKSTKLDPKLLIEEMGKTGIFELGDPAPPPVLARMAAGDRVSLRMEGPALFVENSRGETLGRIPVKAAARLAELMRGGNEYVAGVTSVSEKNIKVLIREMRQAPAMDGRVSFPSKGGPLPPELRAYTKDRALRYDLDDEDVAGDDTDDEAEENDTEVEESTADIEYYEGDESRRSE